MKLLSITGSVYFITASLLILVGGIISYQILKSVITVEFDRKLLAEKEQFIFELKNYDELKDSYYLNIGDKIEIIPVKADPTLEPTLKDTVMYDDFEGRNANFRQIKFATSIGGQYYIITISKSLLGTEELITAVEEIILIFAVGLLVSLGFSNWIIANRIWSPFYQTMDQLREFKLSNPSVPLFRHTVIREFRELNEALTRMVKKSIHDYFNLKEFTENSSHEIQTPLSIIKSKSELLLQEKGLEPRILSETKKIYDAASRLARVLTGLTLLSRIENDQYFDDQPIGLKTLLTERLENYEEMIEFKKLSLQTNVKGSPIVKMDQNLADILLSNLIKNSIRHNKEGGDIEIFLDQHSFLISNTGHPLKNPPDKLFDRFRRDNPLSKSPGLGLSLVKKICDHYNFKLHYVFRDGRHRMSILFAPENDLENQG